MTDGLITRIGKWIDSKFEEKASMTYVVEANENLGRQILAIQKAMQSLEISDLKTRLERIEIYSGMTRKVDPTKPPVAKSAFSM